MLVRRDAVKLGIALLIAAVVFQLFLRYQYIDGWRIDRLTGNRCAMVHQMQTLDACP